jgi:hydrogenase maturation factor HypF (carbamoyltransferase family)
MSLLLIGSLAFSCARNHDAEEVIIPDNPFNIVQPMPMHAPMPIVEPKKKKKKKKKKKSTKVTMDQIKSTAVLPIIDSSDEFFDAFIK